MYPWKNLLQTDRQLKLPIYLQLTNKLIHEISSGRLAPGQKLPSSRKLAALLDLNRKTVIMAMEEVMSQGWIELKPSRGAFVSEELPLGKPQALGHSPKPDKAQTSFSLDIPNIRPSIYDESPQGLSFTDGSPDVRLAPLSSLYRHMRNFGKRSQYLKYGDMQGEVKLRETLASYLSETRGLSCEPRHIFLSRGSQMSIFLGLASLLKSGGKVAVGESNYPVVNELVQYLGGSLLSIGVDRQGLRVADLEKPEALKELKAIYLTPHHHYPTTVTLSTERRLKLLQLAQSHRFAILEDDYDYDFHYAGGPILPMASLDTAGSVIYLGSFSKILAPNIRVGYLVAPENFISAIRPLRKLIDRQGDHVLERALAEMLREGEIQRHLKKSIRIYRQRRDLLVQLLRTELSAWLEFDIPQGGMALWAEFAEHIDLHLLAKRMTQHGVFLEVHPYWGNGLRLGFAALNEEELKNAVGLMRSTLQKMEADGFGA